MADSYNKDEQRGLAEFSEWKEIHEKNKEVDKLKLLARNIDVTLREDFIGQESALKTVASNLRRKLYGLTREDSPLVFLFLGSSGIGKTECAKRMAKCLAEKGDLQFIRIDMSEYQSRHEVSKLIGSPPGYIGHDEGGYLTKQLRKHPKAVVLFDEIEKAHTDILNIFLQLFDEGRLTDGQGKTVNGKDAVYVMTSNLASEEIAEEVARIRKQVKDEVCRKTNTLDEIKNDKKSLKKIADVSLSKNFKDSTVKPILKKHFVRNEFLGRINEIVYFVPFSQSELRLLVQHQLKFWEAKFQRKLKTTFSWSKGLETHFIESYDASYGARSISHEVEHQIVNLITDAYDDDSLEEGSQLKLTLKCHPTTPGEREEIQLLVKKNGMHNFIPYTTNE